MGTSERDINITGYSLWLQFLLDRYGDKIKGYMSLDLFPKNRQDRAEILETAELSIRNTQYMFSEGLTPIPVWKTFWPIDILDYYCSLSEYVAIGGLVGYQGGKSALRHLFERLYKKYPDNVFHMLGVGIRAVMAFKTFRPYSIDFSTWSVAARYGHNIVLDDKQYLKEVALPDEEKERIRKDPVFMKEVVQQNIRSCMSLEDYVETLNEPHQLQMMY